jgi:enterochelin esterase family protein
MPPPLRVFLAAGIYEISGDGVTASILDTNRHLRDVLMAKGVWVRHREYATGHDYVAWQGVLSDGLVALFGRDQP